MQVRYAYEVKLSIRDGVTDTSLTDQVAAPAADVAGVVQVDELMDEIPAGIEAAIAAAVNDQQQYPGQVAAPAADVAKLSRLVGETSGKIHKVACAGISAALTA